MTSNNEPKIMIVASGGGHTTFGLSVAQQLKREAYLIAVIPEGDTLTKKRLQPYVNEFYYTPKGKPSEHLLKRLLKIFLSFPASLKLPKVDVVIATGSNHSLFPALIAKLRGAKLVVIEAIDRTRTRSRTTFLLSKIADIVALHWPEQERLYHNGTVFGPILPEHEVKSSQFDSENYILVTFGSEGFEELFDRLVTLLKNEEVVLQTGKVDPEKYKNVSDKWRVFDFDPKLSEYLKNARIVVTHQGATAAEAAILFRKPTVIVYNHKLKGTSGFEDTKTYADLLGAIFVRNYSEFNKETLEIATKKFKASEHIKAQGAELLAKKILEMVRDENG